MAVVAERTNKNPMDQLLAAEAEAASTSTSPSRQGRVRNTPDAPERLAAVALKRRRASMAAVQHLAGREPMELVLTVEAAVDLTPMALTILASLAVTAEEVEADTARPLPHQEVRPLRVEARLAAQVIHLRLAAEAERTPTA